MVFLCRVATASLIAGLVTEPKPAFVELAAAVPSLNCLVRRAAGCPWSGRRRCLSAAPAVPVV